MGKKSISLIIPAYNEEKLIRNTIKVLYRILLDTKRDFELIVADDGSTDNTLNIVENELKNYPLLRVVSNKRNIGRGSVLTKAFSKSSKDIIGYIDADLQINPSSIGKLISAIEEGKDIAICSKHIKNHKVDYPTIRLFFSKSYSLISRILLNSDIKDYQCGFKVFKKNVIKDLLPLVKDKGWSWDTSILVIAGWKGFKIKEIPARLIKIHNRESKVNLFIYPMIMAYCLIKLLIRKNSFKGRKGYLLLTFDLEEFNLPKEKESIEVNNNKSFEISKQGLINLIRLLQKYNIKCTFFTTLTFAEKYPTLIKKLIQEGHEIALHGYDHKHNYKTMSAHDSYYYINLAKIKLNKLFNIDVLGFRAPKLMFPNYDILNTTGLKYDNSLHPTYIPGHYNNLSSSRHIHKKNKIIILPISVTPFLRLPFSWFWFRNLGLLYSKICSTLCLRDKDYVNIYFHPWEFTNLSKFKFKNTINNLSIRNTGKKSLNNLEKYISWAMNKNLKFVCIKKYLRFKKLI